MKVEMTPARRATGRPRQGEEDFVDALVHRSVGRSAGHLGSLTLLLAFRKSDIKF